MDRALAEDRELQVFALNCDALLHSGLLQVADQPGYDSRRLLHEFRGAPRQQTKANGSPIDVLPYLQDFYSRVSAVRLHHLHGAPTWLRSESAIWMMTSLENLRKSGILDAWMKGTHMELKPILVLGDQKSTQIGRTPIDLAYAGLSAVVLEADQVVISGYSFKEGALNSALRRALDHLTEVIVVDPYPLSKAIVAQRIGVDVQKLKIVTATLTGGLANI